MNVGDILATFRVVDNASKPLHDISAEIDKTAKKTTIAGEAMSSAGRALAGMVTVGAITAAIKQAADYADQLVKMSDKTGISIQSLKQLEAVAADAGNSLEAVAQSVVIFGKNLSINSEETQQGLKRLGMSARELLDMDAAPRMVAFAQALAKVADEAERDRIGMNLMGRSYADLKPTIKALVNGLQEVGGPSEEAVRGMDKLGDAIAKLYRERIKGGLIEAFGGAVVVVDKFRNSMSLLWQGELVEGYMAFTMYDSAINKTTVSMKRLEAQQRAIAAGAAGPLELLPISIKNLEDAMTRDVEAGWKAAERAEEFKKIRLELWLLENGFKDAGVAVWEFGKKFDDSQFAGIVEQLDKIEGRTSEITKDFWEMGRAVGPETRAGAGLALPSRPIPGLSNVAQWTGNGFAVVQEQARVSLTAGFGAALTDFPALMAQAMTGGGGVGGAFKALASNIGATLGGNIAKSIGNSLGKTMGKVFESLLPGIGAMLGPAIEWIGSKLFKTEGKKVNDLRDAFIAAAGGLDALNKKAHDAGMTLDALLKASTVKAYEKAVADLNAELTITAGLQADLADLQATLAGRQQMDWQKAKEIIESYGGTLDSLGPAFTAAMLNDSWKTLWDNWQTLIDMGADVGGTLFAMKEEVQDLVNESLRIGTEIPAQFEPLIKELIRTGQLFDENGQAITDMAQLKFGAPLVSELDKLLLKIDELIEALTERLVPAFATLSTPIKPPWADWPMPDLPAYATGGEGYAGGTHGQYLDFGAGTRVTLHGRERVMTAGEAGGGAPIQITVISQLDGKEVARNQVRYLPSQLTLAGR